MNDVLSNDEVAALVEAAKQGQTEAEPTHKRRARRVRDIDFSRPSKFAQDQQRRLERAHESFARTAGQRLSTELLTQIELDVLSLDQLTWSSAISQIPQPSICATIEFRPLGTQVLMTAELGLMLRLAERLMGGDLGHGRQAARADRDRDRPRPARLRHPARAARGDLERARRDDDAPPGHRIADRERQPGAAERADADAHHRGEGRRLVVDDGARPSAQGRRAGARASLGQPVRRGPDRHRGTGGGAHGRSRPSPSRSAPRWRPGICRSKRCSRSSLATCSDSASPRPRASRSAPATSPPTAASRAETATGARCRSSDGRRWGS